MRTYFNNLTPVPVAPAYAAPYEIPGTQVGAAFDAGWEAMRRVWAPLARRFCKLALGNAVELQFLRNEFKRFWFVPAEILRSGDVLRKTASRSRERPVQCSAIDEKWSYFLFLVP